MQRPGRESSYGDRWGDFAIRFRGLTLTVIASDGDHMAAGLPKEYAWEHVSVSLPNRCPNWLEMDFVCRLFWAEDETVMQLHAPRSEHINIHPHVLHLWRPLLAEIPRPPAACV